MKAIPHESICKSSMWQWNVSGIYKELILLSNNKNYPIKKWAKDLNGHFSKEDRTKESEPHARVRLGEVSVSEPDLGVFLTPHRGQWDKRASEWGTAESRACTVPSWTTTPRRHSLWKDVAKEEFTPSAVPQSCNCFLLGTGVRQWWVNNEWMYLEVSRHAGLILKVQTHLWRHRWGERPCWTQAPHSAHTRIPEVHVRVWGALEASELSERDVPDSGLLKISFVFFFFFNSHGIKLTILTLLKHTIQCL